MRSLKKLTMMGLLTIRMQVKKMKGRWRVLTNTNAEEAKAKDNKGKNVVEVAVDYYARLVNDDVADSGADNDATDNEDAGNKDKGQQRVS